MCENDGLYGEFNVEDPEAVGRWSRAVLTQAVQMDDYMARYKSVLRCAASHIQYIHLSSNSRTVLLVLTLIE